MKSGQSKTEGDSFWKIRSAHYDKLFWTKDKSYIEQIAELGELHENHLVLDVGTGTGAIARAVRGHVGHVVSIDLSEDMLSKGNWTGTSVVKWDINESLFANDLFDRVFARMVFHHILDNLNRAVLRCYDLLKKGGKIILAEGVPPTNDPEIIDWYSEMFKLKEERRTFTPEALERYLIKNGFRNVKSHVHYMENFSIKNWLDNSGLKKSIQNKIFDMHLQADRKTKDAYCMKIKDGDCLVKTKNVIVVGEK